MKVSVNTPMDFGLGLQTVNVYISCKKGIVMLFFALCPFMSYCTNYRGEKEGKTLGNAEPENRQKMLKRSS